MNFFEKYADLQKQKRQIRREMRQKREAITCNAWVDNLEDKKCVKTMSVFGLGVGGFLGASEYERCENFDDEKPCTDYNCILCNKNHAYTNKVDLYNTIKAAQLNLIKEALHLQKQ